MEEPRNKRTSKFLTALGCKSWAGLVGRIFVACFCLAYLVWPYSLAKNVLDTRAFLNRATAHALATTQNSSSYQDYGSSSGGGMPVSTSSCEEDVTFHTSTGQSVTFHASDVANFASLPCYQNSVLVLYDPQHPSDARISDNIPVEVKVDILELVFLLGIPLSPLLLALIGVMLHWISPGPKGRWSQGKWYPL